MKKFMIAIILPLISTFALAQTPPGTIPSCPTPTFKVAVGASITVAWKAPTTMSDGSAIGGAITYNLYSIVGGAAQLIASGLTTTSSVRSNLVAGSPCYAVTATVGGVESMLSGTAGLQVVNYPSAPSGMTCTLVIPAGGGQVSGSCTTQ